MSLHRLAQRTSWIFDLDGTLTCPVHDFGYIRHELDIPETADILEHIAALPEPESRWRRVRLDEIEYRLAERAEAAPGAVEWVRHLHRRGALLGILTRNSRSVALQTLTAIGLAECFDPDHVLGRDEAPPKPDPAGIHHLLDLWRVSVDMAVMVGDYLYDLQAGRAAGTMTVQVGRPDGKQWPDEADLLVGTLAEILAFSSGETF